MMSKIRYVGLMIVSIASMSYGLDTVVGSSKNDSLFKGPFEKQAQILKQEKPTADVMREAQLNAERFSSDLTQSKELLKRARNNQAQFLQKKIGIVSQTYNYATEAVEELRQLQSLYDQNLSLIEEYHAGPQRVALPQKSIPSFDDLQEAARRIFDANQRLQELEKNKLSFSGDIYKRKKALDSAKDQLKEKKKQSESFIDERQTQENGLSKREQGELFDETIKQLNQKIKLSELKLKESEVRLGIIEVQIAILRSQLTVYKEDFNRIKRSVVIDAVYVKRAQDILEKQRQQSAETRDRVADKIRLLAPLRDEFKGRLDTAMTRYNLTPVDVAQISEWTKEPKNLAEWSMIASIGNLTSHMQVLDSEREFLEAQISLERARLRNEEIEFENIKSWQKMTQGKVRDNEEEIDQEIREYGIQKTEFQVDLAALTDKRASTLNSLQLLNSMLDRVKTLSSNLKSMKNKIGAEKQSEYMEAIRVLYDAEEQIRRRIDVNARLIETYTTTMAVLQDTIKRIEDVTGELNTKGFWRRSTQSIEWSELRNFFPDMRRFVADLVKLPAKFFTWEHFKSIGQSIYKSFDLANILLMIIRLLIVILLYVVLRFYIPDFRNYLLLIGPEYGAFSSLTQFTAAILGFVYQHFVSIFVWLVAFLAIKTEILTDTYIAVFFYVASIPYLIYMTYHLFRYIEDFNAKRGYQLVSSTFERRFNLIISSLAYATIVLFFVREAFILMHYSGSQVPAILIGINIFILQIAIISLIGKEPILSLIPESTPLWEWIKEHFSKYYYILVAGIIGIIIMMNPYVGYGRQVLYILSRLLFTALLIPLFSWLHNRLKRALSDLFFYYSDGETIKERFVAGKTWYGLFVIATFLGFVGLGLLLGAWVWGYSLTLRDLWGFLEYSIYSPGIDETTGKVIQVTLLQLFKIFLFIFGGLLLTYIINHYVLRRIFDPLLVGSGVQNTIITLTRYVIILIAFIIGMQSAGLDALTTKIAVAVGLISYYLKELVLDVFAYFIILIQRPIKIGDWIFIDSDNSGVVRQITPRSTILRRRNSETLIIPNSQIITRTVQNWNFTRTYFAFDDLYITIPYYADAHKARQLMFKVLEENHNVLKSPAPIVWLQDFAENGYHFMVRGYLTADKVLDRWEIASTIRLEIVRKLKENGMEIASPTRVIRYMDQGQKPEMLGPSNQLI